MNGHLRISNSTTSLLVSISSNTNTTTNCNNNNSFIIRIILSSQDHQAIPSTHMASQQITEEAVYLCTGNPLPKDIEQISHWLLNESFAVSFKRIYEIKARKGLALVDIAREVTMFVFRIKMPSDVRVQLINDLADIEYRLSFGCNDKLQLGSLISTFARARSALVAAAK